MTGGSALRLSVAIDFAEARAARLFVPARPFAPIGTLRLRHLENTALDADGGALPSRGRDGSSSRPGLASPDRRPPHERQPSHRTGHLHRRRSDHARPGRRNAHDAAHDRWPEVVGTLNDSSCRPDRRARAPSSTRLHRQSGLTRAPPLVPTPGCMPAVNCTGIRALVFSFDEATDIPDGAALYTCALEIDSGVAPGAYSLAVTNVLGSTADGKAIDTGGVPVALTVSGAAGVRRAAATTAHVCSGGASDGAPCTVDADCAAGACVLPLGVCDGGDDDGLLCDCPGGSCRAAGAACGGGPDAGICNGGDADGSCCDRTFSCRGGHACVTTHRLCASGPVKGSPCLADAQCLGSACLASAAAAGGDLTASPASMDPTASPRPASTRTHQRRRRSSSRQDADCVARRLQRLRDRHPAATSYWWMAPALLLLVRRGSVAVAVAAGFSPPPLARRLRRCSADARGGGLKPAATPPVTPGSHPAARRPSWSFCQSSRTRVSLLRSVTEKRQSASTRRVGAEAPRSSASPRAKMIGMVAVFASLRRRFTNRMPSARGG